MHEFNYINYSDQEKQRRLLIECNLDKHTGMYSLCATPVSRIQYQNMQLMLLTIVSSIITGNLIELTLFFTFDGFRTMFFYAKQGVIKMMLFTETLQHQK